MDVENTPEARPVRRHPLSSNHTPLGVTPNYTRPDTVRGLTSSIRKKTFASELSPAPTASGTNEHFVSPSVRTGLFGKSGFVTQSPALPTPSTAGATVKKRQGDGVFATPGTPTHRQRASRLNANTPLQGKTSTIGKPSIDAKSPAALHNASTSTGHHNTPSGSKTPSRLNFASAQNALTPNHSLISRSLKFDTPNRHAAVDPAKENIPPPRPKPPPAPAETQTPERSRPPVQASRTDEDVARQWRERLKQNVFYLEIYDRELRRSVEGQLKALGSKTEIFLHAKVTHLVIEHGGATESTTKWTRPPGMKSTALDQAEKFNIKVWNVSRLLAVLKAAAPTHANNSNLQDHLRDERIYGVSTARRLGFNTPYSAGKGEFRTFPAYYLLVDDATQVHRSVIVKEYDKAKEGGKVPWPKLYLNGGKDRKSVFEPGAGNSYEDGSEEAEGTDEEDGAEGEEDVEAYGNQQDVLAPGKKRLHLPPLDNSTSTHPTVSATRQHPSIASGLISGSAAYLPRKPLPMNPDLSHMGQRVVVTAPRKDTGKDALRKVSKGKGVTKEGGKDKKKRKHQYRIGGKNFYTRSGFCENCNVKYDAFMEVSIYLSKSLLLEPEIEPGIHLSLPILQHIRSRQHREWASKSHHFLQIDSLIRQMERKRKESSVDVDLLTPPDEVVLQSVTNAVAESGDHEGVDSGMDHAAPSEDDGEPVTEDAEGSEEEDADGEEEDGDHEEDDDDVAPTEVVEVQEDGDESVIEVEDGKGEGGVAVEKGRYESTVEVEDGGDGSVVEVEVDDPQNSPKSAAGMAGAVDVDELPTVNVGDSPMKEDHGQETTLEDDLATIPTNIPQLAVEAEAKGGSEEDVQEEQADDSVTDVQRGEKEVTPETEEETRTHAQIPATVSRVLTEVMTPKKTRLVISHLEAGEGEEAIGTAPTAGLLKTPTSIIRIRIPPNYVSGSLRTASPAPSTPRLRKRKVDVPETGLRRSKRRKSINIFVDDKEEEEEEEDQELVEGEQPAADVTTGCVLDTPAVGNGDGALGSLIAQKGTTQSETQPHSEPAAEPTQSTDAQELLTEAERTPKITPPPTPFMREASLNQVVPTSTASARSIVQLNYDYASTSRTGTVHSGVGEGIDEVGGSEGGVMSVGAMGEKRSTGSLDDDIYDTPQSKRRRQEDEDVLLVGAVEMEPNPNTNLRSGEISGNSSTPKSVYRSHRDWWQNRKNMPHPTASRSAPSRLEQGGRESPIVGVVRRRQGIKVGREDWLGGATSVLGGESESGENDVTPTVVTITGATSRSATPTKRLGVVVGNRHNAAMASLLRGETEVVGGGGAESRSSTNRELRTISGDKRRANPTMAIANLLSTEGPTGESSGTPKLHATVTRASPLSETPANEILNGSDFATPTFPNRVLPYPVPSTARLNHGALTPRLRQEKHGGKARMSPATRSFMAFRDAMCGSDEVGDGEEVENSGTSGLGKGQGDVGLGELGYNKRLAMHGFVGAAGGEGGWGNGS
ncbi:hypothetical protein HK097_009628 [Rhizophlyctis rosea]|uniref:DBF4-type domain-containing protein n=1 Tax=Rhizophlyctis rosea TaxID=64517 RepID=A0AAD5X333_9FUNG|nr:hypothetical protein HK097_009628 [Rhizophlyctis rosea]